MIFAQDDFRFGLKLIADEECDEVAAAYYARKTLEALAAAPAPSSLAGGAGEALHDGDIRWLTDVLEELMVGRAKRASEGLRIRRLQKYLRARSSAPEAREEALGNLLAVIHRDGGHRAVEVGVAQAAVEAEKIVANLLSSAPEAREGEPGCPNGHQPGCECDVAEEDVARSKPAAAAPSADKLRIAVEALKPFANLGVSSGPDDEPCHYAYRITRGAIRNARQALAALKAEVK